MPGRKVHEVADKAYGSRGMEYTPEDSESVQRLTRSFRLYGLGRLNDGRAHSRQECSHARAYRHNTVNPGLVMGSKRSWRKRS
jgi:hypothetical protein